MSIVYFVVVNPNGRLAFQRPQAAKIPPTDIIILSAYGVASFKNAARSISNIFENIGASIIKIPQIVFELKIPFFILLFLMFKLYFVIVTFNFVR